MNFVMDSEHGYTPTIDHQGMELDLDKLHYKMVKNPLNVAHPFILDCKSRIKSYIDKHLKKNVSVLGSRMYT